MTKGRTLVTKGNTLVTKKALVTEGTTRVTEGKGRQTIDGFAEKVRAKPYSSPQGLELKGP